MICRTIRGYWAPRRHPDLGGPSCIECSGKRLGAMADTSPILSPGCAVPEVVVGELGEETCRHRFFAVAFATVTVIFVALVQGGGGAGTQTAVCELWFSWRGQLCRSVPW